MNGMQGRQDNWRSGRLDVVVAAPARPPRGTDHCNGPADLAEQNKRHAGTGGVSQGNRALGFAPAFQDQASGEVFLSRFADGSPAPFHLLDGLPGHLVTARDAAGHPQRVVDRLVAGFVRCGRFYTREQAAQFVRLHA